MHSGCARYSSADRTSPNEQKIPLTHTLTILQGTLPDYAPLASDKPKDYARDRLTPKGSTYTASGHRLRARRQWGWGPGALGWSPSRSRRA